MVDTLRIGDRLKIKDGLNQSYTVQLIYIPQKLSGKYILFTLNPSCFAHKFYLSKDQLQDELIKRLHKKTPQSARGYRWPKHKIFPIMNTVEFYHKGVKFKTYKSHKPFSLLRPEIIHYLNSIDGNYPKENFGAPYKFRVIITTPKLIYRFNYIGPGHHYLESVGGNREFQPQPARG